MKKGICKFIKMLLLVILIYIFFLAILGYRLYAKEIKEKSINLKVDEIREVPDYIKINEIPDIYINAVVAVEDHRFYTHKGIDIHGIFRAISRNVKNWEMLEGGSTITQQLAKNTYLEQNGKLTRKIAEGFMAVKYEKELSKDDILELYINTCYFGNGYYNLKQASKGYFKKNPMEMSDYEATMLAGIPNAPSIYSPTVNFDLASQRQKKVLGDMVRYGYMSEEKKDIIVKETEYYKKYFATK